MANEKLTERTELTTAANNDVLHVVDVSDNAVDPDGNSKQIQVTNLMKSAPVQSVAGRQGSVTLTTSDVAEGTNQYHTTARVNNVIAASSVTAHTDVTSAGSGQIVTSSERTSWNTAATTAATNAANITTYYNEVTGDIAALDTRVTTNEGNIVSLDGQVQTNSTDIGSLDGDLNALTTRVTAAEGNITANDGDISTLQVGLAQEITDRVADVNTEEARALAAEANLQTQITANDGDISVNAGGISANAGDITALNTRVTQNESDIAANSAAIPANITDLSDTPSNYGTTGQVLTSNGSGTIWTTPSSGGGGGAVESVNGFTGVVVLDSDNIIQGSTNLYYTEERVSANADVVANTAKVGITTAQADAIEANTLKNSYPTADASKLAGIDAGAEVNPTASEVKTLYESNPDTNAFSDAEQTKLAGIDAGAEVNVNADWNAASGDAQILNKPTLAAVATSGAYSDLSGVPAIPTALSDLTGDTGDVTEGSNLYYTDVRVNTLLASRNISASYATIPLTGNTFLTPTHEQKMLICDSPSGFTIEIRTGLERDAEVLIYQAGAGAITIQAGAGVTLRNTSGFLDITSEQYAIVGLKKLGTSEVWVITGERKTA